jgi:hypothetical protein
MKISSSLYNFGLLTKTKYTNLAIFEVLYFNFWQFIPSKNHFIFTFFNFNISFRQNFSIKQVYFNKCEVITMIWSKWIMNQCTKLESRYNNLLVGKSIRMKAFTLLMNHSCIPTISALHHCSSHALWHHCFFKIKNSLMTYPFLGQIKLDEVYGSKP